MNSENFLHYLKNPSHLYEITYQELKSLVLQYPYCHNLRYLLVTKSKIENHKDYSNDLKVAATYSLDRSLLHNQIVHNKYHQTSTDGSVVISEDYLELTELNKLEEKIEKETVLSLGDEVELVSKGDTLLDLNAINLAKTVDEVEPTASEISVEKELSNLNLIDQIMEEENADSEMSSDELSPLLEQKEPPNIVNYEDLIEDEEEEEPVEEEEEESADYDSDSGLDVLLSDEEDLEEELEDEDYDSYEEEDSASHHQTDPEEITIEPLTKLEVLALNIDEEDEYIEEDEEEDEYDDEEDHSEEEDEGGLESASYIDTSEDSGLQPTPKQSFSSWLKQLQPPSESINYEKTMEEVKEEKPIVKKKKHKTHKIAKKSIMENEEIASETLAHLLASQGYYKKAIRMYEKLSQRHPEKRDLFAAKIVTLLDLKDKDKP